MGVSLARANLVYDWRRYLAAIMAVAFSGLLILIQAGLLLGMFGTVSTAVDRSRADIWLTAPAISSIDLARDMNMRDYVLPYLNTDVKRVEPLLFAWGDWHAPGGAKVMTYLWGVDPSPDSLGFPAGVAPELRLALAEPGGVLIDESETGKLKAGLGDTAEINGKKVRVVGLLKGFRSIGGANVYASAKTFREINRPLDAENAQFFLVSLTDPSRKEPVRARLQQSAGRRQYQAWTKEGLSLQSQKYWLVESGAGSGFAFSTLLGILVGTAITSQTLRSAILANLREYATLRALGVSIAGLRKIVLEQALLVGATGTALTLAIAAAVWGAAGIYNVSMEFPWWLISGTMAFTLAISLASGLVALNALYKSEPAELLR